MIARLRAINWCEQFQILLLHVISVSTARGVRSYRYTGTVITITVRPGGAAVFRYASAGRSAGVGRDLERDRPLAQRGAAREREGAFGNAVITADVRYFLVTKHYRRQPPDSDSTVRSP